MVWAWVVIPQMTYGGGHRAVTQSLPPWWAVTHLAHSPSHNTAMVYTAAWGSIHILS